MAGKYDDLAAQVVELVGGKSNVKSVAHCITRVRFKLKDESKANDEAISELPNVIKVMHANGQYQVVVGNIVEDVYDAILKVGGFAEYTRANAMARPLNSLILNFLAAV